MTTHRNNILVIKLSALGDFILTLGPMAAIRRHHQNDHITLMTTAPYAALAQKSGLFDDIIIDPRPKWTTPLTWLALRKTLNKGGFSRVYDLQNNDRTALYFSLFARPHKPEWVGAARGASHRNTDPTRTQGHAFDGHVQTLALAGITDITPDTLDWITPDHDFAATLPARPAPCALPAPTASTTHPAPYVLLVPGCAPTRPEKKFPAEHYAQLAQHLHHNGFTPVIIGTHAESDTAQIICDAEPNAVNLTEKTTLSDLPALGRRAAAAIGNDTGPMYMIAPTGCPCYGIFSRHSDPIKHAPLGANVHIIQLDDFAGSSAKTVIDQININHFKRH